MSKCPRVQERISCPECGYSISESYYILDAPPDSQFAPPDGDPGHEDNDE